MNRENTRITGIEDELVVQPTVEGKGSRWLKALGISVILLLIGAGIAAGVYYLMWKKNQAGQKSRLDNLHTEYSVDSKIMLPDKVIQDPDLIKAIDLYKKDYVKSAKFAFNEILEKNKPDDVRAASLVYLGIIADEEGNFNLARDFFQRAIKIEADNFFAHYNLAIALRHSGKFKEALEELEIAKRINPSLVHPDLVKGQIQYESQDYANAEETFRDAASRARDPLAYYNLGMTYKKEGKIAEAKAAFMEALNLAGSGETAALASSQLGIIHATQGDYENAEHYFERCVNIMPATPRYYYNLARVQYATGKFEDAIRNMSMAEKYGAKDPKIYVYLSRLYSAMNEKERAFLVLQKGLDAAPRSSMLLNAYADAAIEIQKWNEAIVALRRGLEVSTGSKERGTLLYNLGRVYYELNDLENAESHLERALDLDPVNDEIIILLARSYMRSGKKDKSVAAFNKAIQINPDNVNLLVEAGRMYYEIGLITEAENHFKRVLETPGAQKDQQTLSLLYLAKIHKKRQHYDEAVTSLEKALLLNPDKNTLESIYLEMGDSILRSNKPSAVAVGYIEKALAVNPTSGKARILLADALIQKGDMASMERAEENLSSIIQSSTQPAILTSAYTFRGILYFKNGMFMKALDDFNSALEKDPSNETAFHNRRMVLAKLERN